MWIRNFVYYMGKWLKHMMLWKKDDLNEELADITIYLMELSEVLGFDLEDEIEEEVSKNEKRLYKI